MFFPRLRTHAKWVFLLLAIFLAVTFVAFGVGAGGIGVGDIFRGSAGSGESAGDARKRTEKNPDDAQAWRDLSTALQTDGDTAGAISALDEYTVLKPKDPDGFRELGGLLIAHGQELSRQASLAQAQAVYAGASSQFGGSLRIGETQLGSNRIAETLAQQANERVIEISSLAGAEYEKAVTAYETVATLLPDDPNVQLELAQAAEQAGAVDSAIAAYERFLKLAPDDPNAAIVKEQLKQFRASQAATSG